MANTAYPIQDAALAWFSRKERDIITGLVMPQKDDGTGTGKRIDDPDRVSLLQGRYQAKCQELQVPVTNMGSKLVT